MKRNANWQWWLSASAIALASACVDGPEGPSPNPDPDPVIVPNEPQPMPREGQSDFVSADGQAGEATADERGNNGQDLDTGAEADGAGDEERTVEEGDIYRVLDGTDKILNLNAYRGLQIIDFSDVDNPEIIGHVQVSGTPVEMYSVGDRVYVLLNNWQGYWGGRDDVDVQTFNGGLVLAIDTSDPTKPVVTGRAKVPGYIQRSRLTRGNGDEALFVVTTDWQSQTTYVQSYSVSDGGRLAEKTRIDVDTQGYLTDIQASNELLMVARWDWNRGNSQGSEVTLIDISNPDGTMVEGDTIEVDGYVAKKTNMSHHGDMLRVVSGNSWRSQGDTNYVQTFDISDIADAKPVDSETFGDGESLFATIFLGEKAFFVTYEQVDPFHAFSIDGTGQIEEKSEFVISGWNDFFKPVSNETRLVGIGKNDQNGVTLAVSLYDIEDLTNPNPLVDREELDLDWSWSEANWDDRAFTVLEGGTSAVAPTGEVETGLVLLPFSGWDDSSSTYKSGVQIFTFSDDTLTKRGTMEQDTQVRRSFVADPDANTTGNLSEAELSLFDTTNPDQPQELSRLELAPNYRDILVFGDHGVRRRSNQAYWGWWGYNHNVQLTDTVQVIGLAGDVDQAATIAEFEIPAGARLIQMDDKLVAISNEYVGNGNNTGPGQGYRTSLEVWDLADPTQPTPKGTLVSDKLPPLHYGYYDYYGGGPFVEGGGAVDGLSYYWHGQFQAPIHVVGDALVLIERGWEQKLEGEETVVYTQPSNYNWDDCWDDQTYEPKACTYLQGSTSCRQLTRLDGTKEAEVCTGAFHQCTQDADGETECTPYTPDPSEVEEHTYTHEKYRYWTTMNFHGIDVTDASNPKLGPVKNGGQNNEAAGVLAKDDILYFSYRRPYRVPGDNRPFVKYFFRAIDYSNPAAPVKGAAVNVPGQVIQVEGNTVLTQDALWGSNIVETAINKLKVVGNRAYLQGGNRFTDRLVDSVQLDGAGHVLVSHRESWLSNYARHGYDWEDWDNMVDLSILDLNDANLKELSRVDIDHWATLYGAVDGKALFQVPGGMLVVNVSDAANAHAQAYFALRGWPQDFALDGDTILFAAGPFGLYSFDTDDYNLLAP